MKKTSRVILMLLSMLTVLMVSAVSVFAAPGVDWNDSKITVTGMGVAPVNARSASQAMMMARRAAMVDAYRQIAEMVKGVNVDSETTVENAMVTSDVTRTKVSAFIQGAEIVSERSLPQGGYEMTMSVPMFGVSNSLASAVMPQPAGKTTFPSPSASGRAAGGYTGLIVDCSGMKLNPVMSPVIKNAEGTPIYGYKNLDYDYVVSHGMAGYSNDIHRATRAGSNPLIVRAIRLDNHNSNPVLSLADANRVLLENEASGFLDRTNVVFVR